MSDTESVRGDTSEEYVEEMEEEILTNDGEAQTMMKNGGGTVITVITRNVKVS